MARNVVEIDRLIDRSSERINLWYLAARVLPTIFTAEDFHVQGRR